MTYKMLCSNKNMWLVSNQILKYQMNQIRLAIFFPSVSLGVIILYIDSTFSHDNLHVESTFKFIQPECIRLYMCVFSFISVNLMNNNRYPF